MISDATLSRRTRRSSIKEARRVGSAAERAGSCLDIFRHLGVFFYLLDQFSDRFVGCGGHDKALDKEDVDRDNEVAEEEFARSESLSGSIVNELIEKKDDAGRIKGPSEHGKNEARVGRKCIRQLEGRNEDERSAEGKKEISCDPGIKWSLAGKPEKQTAACNEYTAHDPTGLEVHTCRVLRQLGER